MGIRRPGRLPCRCRCRIRVIATITPPVSIPAAKTATGGICCCWVSAAGSAGARLAGWFCPAGPGPGAAAGPAGLAAG